MDKKNPVGTFLQGRQERERRGAAGGSESNKRGINLPDSWEGQHDFAPVLGILLQRVSLQIHCFQVLRSFQLIQVAPALDEIIVHLQSTYSTPTQTYSQARPGSQQPHHTDAAQEGGLLLPRGSNAVQSSCTCKMTLST